MKKALFVLLTAALMLPIPAVAGPLQESHVRGDAQWLMHVNLDAFRDSHLGKLIRDDVQAQYQDKIDALAQLLGSDPTKDLTAVTLFGPDSEEQNASVLVYGNYDKDKLLTLLVLNPAYSKSEYNGTTIHHWKDEKNQKEQYGAFAADNVIVIAQAEAAVADALNVIAGKNPSLAAKSDSALYSLVQERSGAIAMAAAVSLSELAENNEHAAVLENSTLFAALADEKDGNLKLSVHLEALDEESAMKIEQVVRGLLAFASLQTAEQPQIGQLIQAVGLSRGENVIDCTFSYPSEKLYEMFKSDIKINIDENLK